MKCCDLLQSKYLEPSDILHDLLLPALRRKFDKYFEPNNCHDVPDLIWHKYQYFT